MRVFRAFIRSLTSHPYFSHKKSRFMRHIVCIHYFLHVRLLGEINMINSLGRKKMPAFNTVTTDSPCRHILFFSVDFQHFRIYFNAQYKTVENSKLFQRPSIQR